MCHTGYTPVVSLDNAFARYKNGAIDWTSFASICYTYIVDFMGSVLRIPLKERIDIAGEFYPRFCNLANRYEEQGSSFETYVKVSVRFFCRSYAERRGDQESQELLVSDVDELPYGNDETTGTEQTRAVPFPTASPAVRDSAVLTDTRTKDTVRRQLLISYCKNFPVLTDAEADRIASALQIPQTLVDGLAVYVHDRRSRYHERRFSYRRKRDYHFHRMQSLQRRGTTQLTVHEQRNLVDCVAYHRDRWYYYRERLSRQNIRLSNREVASLLGIPKGSVDSAMVNLGRRLEGFSSTRYL